MSAVETLLLFLLAAVAEIGGVWLIWQASANIAAWSGSVPGSLRWPPRASARTATTSSAPPSA